MIFRGIFPRTQPLPLSLSKGVWLAHDMCDCADFGVLVGRLNYTTRFSWDFTTLSWTLLLTYVSKCFGKQDSCGCSHLCLRTENLHPSLVRHFLHNYCIIVLPATGLGIKTGILNVIVWVSWIISDAIKSGATRKKWDSHKTLGLGEERTNQCTYRCTQSIVKGPRIVISIRPRTQKVLRINCRRNQRPE